MRMKRLGAAVAAMTLAGIGFLASASPANATNCDWYREHKPQHLPEHCKPKTTTTKKAETTTTTEKATTTTAAPKTTTTVAVKPETKPTPVKAKPKFTG